ncbi:MmcQ/YjbR family DNA-binding protein [Herbiconiux sp. P15]|uniref:MmcQ/YjbR family DNA-binding protein n=1 Tax=Herbiconiux liukaitaii TaxID=3342799 RepID=UPI0035B96C91
MSADDDVRRLAMGLPSVEERPSHGMASWYVTGWIFARLHEEPGVLVCWRADLGEREALLQRDPETFFTTPHYDGHASVLVRLERVGQAELNELLREAWEIRAPKRLRDSATTDPEPSP